MLRYRIEINSRANKIDNESGWISCGYLINIAPPFNYTNFSNIPSLRWARELVLKHKHPRGQYFYYRIRLSN